MFSKFFVTAIVLLISFAIMSQQVNAGDTACTSDKFLALYFPGQSGSTTPLAGRCEDTIDHHWNGAVPLNGVPATNFYATWSKTLNFENGEYYFNVNADDGVRVYLAGTLIIDGWKDQPATLYTRKVNVTEGRYQVKIEYYQKAGSSEIQFNMGKENGSSDSCSDSTPKNKFCAEYFNDTYLDNRIAEFDVDKIDNDWGYSSPLSQVNSDQFSIRWQGKFKLKRGTYEFKVKSDDGMRIYIEDEKVYDEWRDQPDDERQFRYVNNSEGYKEIKVEYYEGYGEAVAKVKWTKVSNSSNPTNTPTPSPSPTPNNITQYVTNEYNILLNRQPDQGGLNSWISRINNGSVSCSELPLNFIRSDEYKSRYITNDVFIMALPRILLFRSIDTNYEFNYWRNVWAGLDQNLSLQQKREEILRRYISLNYQAVAQKCSEHGITRI